MNVEKVRVEKKIGNYVLSLETGWLAKQASACVVAAYGDTVVLNAVTTGPPRPGIDFFPLTCDYRERLSAAGKFPGGFLKREGRPSMKETLTARLMDRPIRPSFPEWFHDEVQCQAIVVSSDKLNDADMLAMNGTAAALHISEMPFDGPIASVRLGRIDEQLVPFPTMEELEDSDLDLIVSGSMESVLMIEGFAREMPEDTMLAAIRECHRYIREICQLQQELYERVGAVKKDYPLPTDDGLFDRVCRGYYDQLRAAKGTPGKAERREAVSAVRHAALAEIDSRPRGSRRHRRRSLQESLA